MRWRGLEPPRAVKPTRPSTLRVYQFRHQRSRDRHCSRRVNSLRRVRELCDTAVAAALAAGASYADARVVLRRAQTVATKNGRVDRLDDVESEGVGVRVIVGGAWGFACDRRLDDAGAREAAVRACEFARAAPGPHERALAPVEAHTGEYRAPMEKDPLEVPLDDKIALCLRAEEAMKHDDVKVTSAFVRAQKETKVFVSSDGAAIEQQFVECGGGIDVFAANDELAQIRSYPSAHIGSSAQGGWEVVERLELQRE